MSALSFPVSIKHFQKTNRKKDLEVGFGERLIDAFEHLNSPEGIFVGQLIYPLKAFEFRYLLQSLENGGGQFVAENRAVGGLYLQLRRKVYELRPCCQPIEELAGRLPIEGIDVISQASGLTVYPVKVHGQHRREAPGALLTCFFCCSAFGTSHQSRNSDGYQNGENRTDRLNPRRRCHRPKVTVWPDQYRPRDRDAGENYRAHQTRIVSINHPSPVPAAPLRAVASCPMPFLHRNAHAVRVREGITRYHNFLDKGTPTTVEVPIEGRRE